MTPTYAVPHQQQHIPRDAVILDTNVLVAAFCPRDQHHEDARFFIDECTAPLLVPIAVLIETWGMIVGSYRYWDGGMELLLWLNTPGNAELLPQDTVHSEDTSDLVGAVHVDYVDALVSHLADDVSKQCQFDPNIRIATYDAADITKCRRNKALHLLVLDMRSIHEY